MANNYPAGVNDDDISRAHPPDQEEIWRFSSMRGRVGLLHRARRVGKRQALEDENKSNSGEK